MLGGCLIVGVVLLVVASCAVGTTAWAFFHATPATATTTQTFAVTEVPSVRIHSPAGNIDVVRGEVGSVTVQVTKYARALSAAAAQDELRQMTATVTQAGDTLDVQVSEPLFAGHLQLWDDRHVDLHVVVPAQANVAATLDAGNVDIAGITGILGVQDSAGNIRLSDVTLAGSSFATENAGNIDVTGALQPGASFAARNNAGNVTAILPRDTSAHLTASADAGNVTVDPVWLVSVSRQAASATASGNLTPDPTGTLILETNAGNVTLVAQ
jgi:hypothetical protein